MGHKKCLQLLTAGPSGMADASGTEPVIQGVTAPTERGDVPRRPRMLIAAGTAPHNLHNLTQIFEEPKICILHIPFKNKTHAF